MSEGGAPRLVEVSPERYPAWRSRFDGANATKDEPQRIVAVDRFDHDPLGLVLVRRGGYAVGLVAGGVLVAHKIGTAHVQGRTKKGGWSQQRYARRRGHQSDEVVERWGKDAWSNGQSWWKSLGELGQKAFMAEGTALRTGYTEARDQGLAVDSDVVVSLVERHRVHGRQG